MKQDFIEKQTKALLTESLFRTRDVLKGYDDWSNEIEIVWDEDIVTRELSKAWDEGYKEGKMNGEVNTGLAGFGEVMKERERIIKLVLDAQIELNMSEEKIRKWLS